MKKLKYSIMILIGIIIIISMVIFNRSKHINAEDKNLKAEGEYYRNKTAIDTSIKNYFMPVTDATRFYTVETCINQYLIDISTYVSERSSEAAQKEAAMTETQRKQRIYDVLHESYINQNNITVENVRSHVLQTDQRLTFEATDMYQYQISDSITNYAVYGIVKKSNYEAKEIIGNMYIIVTLDSNNMTFAITPIKEEKNNLEELNIEDKIDRIEKNDYNTFSYSRTDVESLLRKYIMTYKSYVLEKPELAYERLDEEYRNKKFGNIEEYKRYIQENKDVILGFVLDRYQKTEEDGYTQYTCVGKNGNYYIFKEDAIMQYSLLADTYTIDIPEFVEKYNQSDNETKMGMNIEKIVSAINNKDSRYLYSKLADGFKNNYFQSEEAFRQYMQTTFFEKNTVEYESVDNEGKNYMFDIVIRNANNVNEKVSKRIIMQFKEGTDFVFSFNVSD